MPALIVGSLGYDKDKDYPQAKNDSDYSQNMSSYLIIEHPFFCSHKVIFLWLFKFWLLPLHFW